MSDLRELSSPLIRTDKQSGQYLLPGPPYSDSKPDSYDVPHGGDRPEDLSTGRARKISASWRVCVEFALAVLLVSWWNTGGNTWASSTLSKMRSSCMRGVDTPAHLVAPTNFDWDEVCLPLSLRRNSLALFHLVLQVKASTELIWTSCYDDKKQCTRLEV